MTLRTLLVHLDDNERCATRVALAARLARVHGGHLVGLLPTGLQNGVVPASAIPSGVTDAIAESADDLRRRADGIRAAFKDAITGPGPLSYEVREVDGATPDAVVRHARTADLIVLGQGDVDSAPDTLVHELAQQVMLQAGRPVLIVPYAGKFEEAPRHALLAWDGSREAAVAIQGALPLLAKASQVTLLCLRRADDVPDPQLLIPEVQHWLLRHGIQATIDEDVTEIPIGDALLARTCDMGADLIVMGGYGHSRLRELMLGGVTREVLDQMTVPVLMAH
jgi:nucleotide-binding universal stress UspA family protein